MALATQCPHCGKRFRVASDQLKLRGGIVRCGACHEIFDGNATLIDLDALPAQPAAAPAVVPAHAGTHTEQAETQPTPAPTHDDNADVDADADADADAAPIYTLDFDHTFDPFGILPKVEPGVDDEPPQAPAPAEEPTEAPEPEPIAGPEPDVEPLAAPVDDQRIEPTLGLPVDEELVAAPLPGHEHDHDELALHDAPAPRPAPQAASPSSPLPLRASAPADPLAAPIPARPSARAKSVEARAARRSKLTPTRIDAPKLRVPEIDEPEFVKRSRQQEQSGKTRRIVMAAASVVLLLVLAAQAVTTFRNTLAARYPSAKPALVAACALLGCRVELPARIDNLTIEQGELTALGTNTYSLATLLHNQGSLVQAWPHIELTLTDANDKPLLRRVFTPAEYLPQGATPATGFAARGEQSIKLYFQLDQLKPSGYRIAVFYP